MESPLFSEVLERKPFLWHPPGEGPWYWRIRSGYEGLGYGPFSTVASFSLGLLETLPAPLLFYPDPGETIPRDRLSRGIDFSWEALEGAAEYHLQIARDPVFQISMEEYSSQESSFTLQKEWEGGVYYWRVSAGNSGVEETRGDPSEVRTFTVLDADPVFSLLSPVGGDTLEREGGEEIGFRWESLGDGVSYQFRLFAKTPEGETLLEETVLNDPSCSFPSPGAGEYVWDVGLFYGEGQRVVLSEPSSFRVIPMVSAPLFLYPPPGRPLHLASHLPLAVEWTSPVGVSSFEVTLTPAGGPPVFQGTVREPRILISDGSVLPSGRYTVRVRSLQGSKGALRKSKKAEMRFELIRSAPPAAADAPVPLLPREGRVVSQWDL
ncbi:MAG: hypothetical protein KVP17_000159, partial [Porospora cf. gigantea B]